MEKGVVALEQAIRFVRSCRRGERRARAILDYDSDTVSAEPLAREDRVARSSYSTIVFS